MKKAIAALAFVLSAIMLLLALNASQRRTAAAELALSEEMLASVSQAASDMECLTLSLDKLRLTASPRQSAALLASISLSADRVQQALASLPDMQGQRAAVLAFLSETTALAQACLADMAATAETAAETRNALISMSGGLQLLLAELSLAQQDLLHGVSLSDLPPTDLTAPPTALELTEYKALPSREVNSGEALQIAKDFVGSHRVIAVAPAPDTTGALPAYGVTVQTPDVQLNLEVTRRGGKILLMAPETASFPMLKTPAECTEAALSFLKSRGFAQMKAPYYQIYDGLCVLTCVYVQDDVLIWPDRVLVQVRMDTAEVVGLEARSYWRNHIPRRLQSPLLTQEEARTSLNSSASVIAVHPCLVLHQNQERRCWQFTLRKGDDTYLSCIDAMTGEELLLEKIIQLEQGQVPA